MTAVGDPALPTLKAALTADGLAAVASLVLGSSAAPQEAVEIMKHVAGKRATLLYTFDDERTTQRVVGKLYRSERRAARMERWLRTLAGRAFPPDGRVRVADPIGASSHLRMLVLPYVEGVDLRNVTDQDEPFALAASWLARLHEADPLEDLKTRTPADEVEKAIHWLDTAMPHVPARVQTRLAKARSQLMAVVAAPPDVELRPIHRDYYYANLLWDGNCIWAIDLDQLRLGDPALDVAHFLAHLEVLAFRTTGAFDTHAARARRFVETYRAEAASSGIDERLPPYAAYTFLKLAATEAERARPGWQVQLEAYTVRACEELEQLD